MDIQWYPGHMTKTRRMMEEEISLVDVVIELVDSRIPFSSKNPDIDLIAKNKKRIIAFNKSDLSDTKATELWVSYYKNLGFETILLNSVTGKGVNDVTDIAKELMRETLERLKARGRIFKPIRSMVVGIPNVGKSTFINKYVGKSLAKTGDKPGVTRGKQWIRIKKDFELLDTPGILWPKFESREVGLRLGITGAINDNILDLSELSIGLISILRNRYSNSLKERYGIDYTDENKDYEILEKIGLSRGFKAKGGDIDYERASKIFLDEFRGGRLGNITLEIPEDILVYESTSKMLAKEKLKKDRERKSAYKKK